MRLERFEFLLRVEEHGLDIGSPGTLRARCKARQAAPVGIRRDKAAEIFFQQPV